MNRSLSNADFKAEIMQKSIVTSLVYTMTMYGYNKAHVQWIHSGRPSFLQRFLDIHVLSNELFDILPEF